MKRNAYFQLDMRPEGEYLIIYPALNGGKELDIAEASNYLQAKNIASYSKVDLRDTISHAQSTGEPEAVKVGAPLGYEISESENYYLSDDKMTLKVIFHAPSTKGDVFSAEQIVNSLISYGIKVGIDQNAIMDFVSNRKYCTEYIFARGIPVREGHHAKIEYFFNTNKSLKPAMNEDGTVDYKSLNNIGHVRRGNLLAKLTPADEGDQGRDVFGAYVKPHPVKRATLQCGSNCSISEDGTELYSEVTGHATLVNGQVFVSDIYEVPADVDNSTGDIKYDGNVCIKGNVRSGFKVVAGGDIIVDGVVEGAVLEADGQIVIKRGIQGVGKGILKAKGNVISKFVENAQVISGGYVETEAILHSNVQAAGEVNVNGKKGNITGGSVSAGGTISAKTLGSSMETRTILRVGMSPEKIELYDSLRASVKKTQEDIDKAYPILTNFMKKRANKEQIKPEVMEYVMKLAAATKANEAKIKEERLKLAALENEMKMDKSASVRCTGECFGGVEIQMSDVSMTTKEKRSYCKFAVEGAEIKVSNL